MVHELTEGILNILRLLSKAINKEAPDADTRTAVKFHVVVARNKELFHFPAGSTLRFGAVPPQEARSLPVRRLLALGLRHDTDTGDTLCAPRIDTFGISVDRIRSIERQRAPIQLDVPEQHGRMSTSTQLRELVQEGAVAVPGSTIG